MTRGRRNRGRRNRNSQGHAGEADDDVAMTRHERNHGRRLPNHPYPNGAPRGPRHEDRPARRRPPNNNYNYSQLYAEDAAEFDVIPSSAAEPRRPASPKTGDDAGAAAANFFDGLFHPPTRAGHSGGSPRPSFGHHSDRGGGGGGVPNRRCAECRSVRKTNLRLRDHVLQCLERARCLLVVWSAEVGVPLDLAADDEMDWQPEPLIRVLLLPADARPSPRPLHLCPHGPPAPAPAPPHPPYPPPGQPPLQPHPPPPPPPPPDQPHQQPPSAYASFPLPAHPPSQVPLGGCGGMDDTPAPATIASATMATTVEEYDEPGESPFAAAATVAPSVASTDADAD